MKYANFKTLALMLSVSALLVLSGCGSDGTPSDSGMNWTPLQEENTTQEETLPGPGELGYQTILPD